MHFARVASFTHLNYNAVWVCIASDLKLVQLIIYLLPDMYYFKGTTKINN